MWAWFRLMYVQCIQDSDAQEEGLVEEEAREELELLMWMEGWNGELLRLLMEEQL
jgi:hypothetical protein